MQQLHSRTHQRTRWLRRSTVLLAFAVVAAGLPTQSVPRSYAATEQAAPTPVPFGTEAVTQTGVLQPRIYLPLLRRNDQEASASPATPGPIPTPVPMPPGMMEPIAPDWVQSCAPNTVPFEAQGWWVNDFGHVHVGFCAPQGQRISGAYTFKVRLTLRNNPGKLTLLQAQIDDSSFVQTNRVDVTCPVGQTCAWDDSVTIDTSAFPNDGWHHLRVRAVVKEPDGKELIATNFIPVYLNNGKPVADFKYATLGGTTDYIAGRGWYTNVNYTWSAIFNPPTAGERVSGIYKVTVRPMATGNPQPISRFVVIRDAAHTAPGETIYDTNSPSTKPIEISIDTTKLANGWHSLLARTESANQVPGVCAPCSGGPQTHAGTTKIWFYVQN